MRHVVAKSVLLLAGVVLLLALLLALFLFVPAFFQMGLKVMNLFLPVTLEVGAFHHVPGELTLGGIRVINETGPFCETGSLRVNYRPASLFAGRFEVTRLELGGVRLKMERFPDGRLNLSGPPEVGEKKQEKEQTSGLVFPDWIPGFLILGDVKVSDSSFVYQDGRNGFSVQGEALVLEGGFSSRPVSGNLRILDGTILLGGEGFQDAFKMETRGEAVLRNGRVELSGFRVRMDGSDLDLEGLYVLDSRRLSLLARLKDVPLDRILNVADIEQVLIGTVSGTIKADATGFEEAHLEAHLLGKLHGQKVELDMQGRYGKGRVGIESVALRHADAVLTGKASLEVGSGNLQGSFSMEEPLVEESFKVHGLGHTRLQGILLKGEIKGTLKNPSVSVLLRSDEWIQNGFRLRGVHAEGSYTGREGVRLEGSAQRMRTPLGEDGKGVTFITRSRNKVLEYAVKVGPSTHVQGRFFLENGYAELAFAAQGLDLTPMIQQWVPRVSRFALSAKGVFQGTIHDRDRWVGDVEIRNMDVRSSGFSLDMDRPSVLHVQKGVLDFSAFARINGKPLLLKGRYPLVPGQAMEIKGSAFLPLEILEGPGRLLFPGLKQAKGDLRVQGVLKGPVSSPRIQASARINDGFLWLTAVRTGSEKEDASHDIVKGRMEGSASLEGSLRQPGGSLDLLLTKGSLYGIPVDEISIKAQSKENMQWTQRTELKSPYGSVSLDGEWEIPSGRIAGRIQSTDLNLGSLFSFVGLPVQGSGRIQGTVKGNIRDPRIAVRMPMESFLVEGISYGALVAEADVDRSRVTARCQMDSGRLSGWVDLGGQKEASLDASLEKFPLGPLLEAFQGHAWKGDVSLEGAIQGPLENLNDWKGSLRISRLYLETAGVPVNLAQPVKLTLAPGWIEIPDASFLFRDGSFRVSGTLGRENRLSLKGILDLKLLDSLLPWLSLDQGEARMDLLLTGSLSSPVIQGPVKVKARNISFQGVLFFIDTLEADILASARGAELRSLVARVDEGEVQGTGRIAWQPFNIDEMNIKMKSLPVRISDRLAGELQGELGFRGNKAGSNFTGSVRILEARYEQDFDLVGTILRPRRPLSRSTKAPPLFFQNMRLDLSIGSGPDLFVRNNIARMILSVDMNIQGTAAAPVPIGRVKVLDGDVYFMKREFDITQGSLNYLGPPDPRPNLNLESRVEVQGKSRKYLVYLSMKGPLDRIELTLSSIPDLSREDILFVLFTGQTQDEYFATSSDVRGTAANLAVSGISSLIGQDVKNLTGLDTFELEGTNSENLGIKAMVGKRISERIEVKGVVVVGTGAETSQAQVEYQLTDWLYLVGTQRTDGSFGLDCRLRFIGD